MVWEQSYKDFTVWILLYAIFQAFWLDPKYFQPIKMIEKLA